jgi:transglutaminase-like putative cysteine protease
VAVTYRVLHKTEYSYTEPVSPSYGQLYVLPRDHHDQTCVSARVVVDPPPDDYRERTDFFGNRVAYFAVQAPHRQLTVTGDSTVVVSDRRDDAPEMGDQPWEPVVERLVTDQTADFLEARMFVLDSPLVARMDELGDYARESFGPNRDLLSALFELSSNIHRDFAYQPGSTSVSTPIEVAFQQRSGVCQDFAHVAIGCLRSLGLAARYVSGYLESAPRPGAASNAGGRVVGGDVSHAWLSVFVPGSGWVDIDPTNAQFVDHRYVTTAWGRDYSDVRPLNGIIYTEGLTNRLTVSVEVRPME